MDKKKIIYIIVGFLIIAGFFLYRAGISNAPEPPEDDSEQEVMQTEDAVDMETDVEDERMEDESRDFPDMEVLAEDLEIPWDLAFLPNGDMLVAERPGRLLRINPEGNKEFVENIEVEHVGEGGLLGLALHPDFEENGLVYLYRTVKSEAGSDYVNRVDSYELRNNKLLTTEDAGTIISGIPGAAYHDGGRLEFGPDGKLYITVGDATNREWAQIYNSGNSLQDLAGSILRLNPDGSIPEDNPFGSAVWSYGHRNPQGLAWDNEGRLWSTEHGRSGLRSGLDEINLIEPGQNYGWPDSQGDTVEPGTTGPKLHSGPNTTWAPASAAIIDNSLFFGGLRGQALYEARLGFGGLDGGDFDDSDLQHREPDVLELGRHLYNEYGRIRAVVVGPDGMLYITTSNRDGRGDVREGDDKIIRINPTQFRQ